MNTNKDGGPAFPVRGGGKWLDPETCKQWEPFNGMSLRDWFAGRALANHYTHDDGNPDKIAQWAYHVADAMLKARENQQ